MQKEKTQVGIIGAGPAGLMLSHLLARAGIDSVVVERRSREYIEKRVRAGVLEQGTVNLMRETGLGARLDREGLVHRGISLRFEGTDHRIAFDELTGGSTITVYGQQEVVKDLIAARMSAGARLHFEIEDASVHDIDSSAPRLCYTVATRRSSSSATSSRAAMGSTACRGTRFPPIASRATSANIPSDGSGFSPPSRHPPRSSSTRRTSADSRC